MQVDFSGMTIQELHSELSILLRKEEELDRDHEQQPLISATDDLTALNDVAARIKSIGEELRRRAH
jgi:hypothetical protein